MYSQQITGLAASTSYTFKVEATDSARNDTKGGPSTTVTTASARHIGNFAPNDLATRAQAAVMLKRMLEHLQLLP